MLCDCIFGIKVVAGEFSVGDLGSRGEGAVNQMLHSSVESQVDNSLSNVFLLGPIGFMEGLKRIKSEK